MKISKRKRFCELKLYALKNKIKFFFFVFILIRLIKAQENRKAFKLCTYKVWLVFKICLMLTSKTALRDYKRSKQILMFTFKTFY